ncbi:MAG TPA: group I intron-associated PD-(D/E)XK endonuclease [Candidatus Binatia bacterium]|nr:group I intron-associated PD-(D/E)XK endonuclease [Candidatus Binatia bacterium]
MKKKLAGERIKGCKERGEWAELCFMAKAAGLGMGVSRPLGESRRYDVLVEAGGRILRVQVKSTIYRRRGNSYSLNVMGPGRKGYKKGTVDFFAVYLIPEDEWYIIPYEVLGKKLTVHFCPGGGRQKYAQYREAWDLLQGGISIQACADEGWDAGGELGESSVSL